MPTLDPPVLEWGDDAGPPRHARRRHPVRPVVATFLAAMVTTVLVVLMASAIGN
jgi:hypothetical protein